MVYEYQKRTKNFRDEIGDNSIILEPFPSEAEKLDFSPGLLYKLLALFLPGPLIFSLLIMIGVRHAADIGPVLLVCWVAVDLLVYLIFFADFSDMGGMRRTGA
jgi:hypothetical protein